MNDDRITGGVILEPVRERPEDSRKASPGIGMPATLYLNQFGSVVWDAFGHPPYHVGSSLPGGTTWRDVDVRLILPDDEYEAMGLGDPGRAHHNAKWVALTMAFSALGRQMTALPIDFQIQQQTHANAKNDGQRSAIGLVPWRFRKQESP